MNWSKKAIAIAMATVLMVPACMAGRENETMGALIGGTLGGLIGSEIGQGEGNEVAIAVGAIAGTLIGAQIGRHLDETSRAKAQQAETRAITSGQVGQQIVWENPNNSSGPASGWARVDRDGRDSSGRTCREYTQEVMIGGDTETMVGTACLGDDGRWTQI